MNGYNKNMWKQYGRQFEYGLNFKETYLEIKRGIINKFLIPEKNSNK